MQNVGLKTKLRVSDWQSNGLDLGAFFPKDVILPSENTYDWHHSEVIQEAWISS